MVKKILIHIHKFPYYIYIFYPNNDFLKLFNQFRLVPNLTRTETISIKISIQFVIHFKLQLKEIIASLEK